MQACARQSAAFTPAVAPWRAMRYAGGPPTVLAVLRCHPPAAAATRPCPAVAPCSSASTRPPAAQPAQPSVALAAPERAAATADAAAGGTPWAAACGVAASLLLTGPAVAADAATTYNPGGGADTLKLLAGAGYIVLVIVYFVRLFRKRAAAATQQPISASVANSASEDSDSDEEEEAALEPQAEATPLSCFIAAAQAGAICYLLFLLSTHVDGYFERQSLPEQYTAHNITVLVQTIVRGLAYLVTFIFGANTLGLTALSVQLLLFPDSLASTRAPNPKAERLPSVSVTDNIFDLRRAFEEAEAQGRRQAEEALRSKDQ